MKKLKAFNMVEIMIVVCLLLTTVILCIPTIFNNSKQARIISSWKKMYGEMQSNFEVYNVSDYDTIRAYNFENFRFFVFNIAFTNRTYCVIVAYIVHFKIRLHFAIHFFPA